MIFLDTSVLVAIAQVSHERHRPSRDLWKQCSLQTAAISTHTIAELYNTLSAMPPVMRLAPRDAAHAVETFLQRLTPVTLTADEYKETMHRTANLGRSGGIIYDALHMACARKIEAERIYTWNVKHFQMVAPDLAERIVTP
ncbi:MAG: PIN domain-containing protein [Terracidiphilus sp.]